MMEIAAYTDAAVKGVPLILVVMGLVWFWGKLGAKGKTQLVSSLATGLVVGVAYMVAVTKPPMGGDWYTQYVYWFGCAVYGLGLGLGASGYYEVKRAAAKPKLVG